MTPDGRPKTDPVSRGVGCYDRSRTETGPPEKTRGGLR